MFVNRNARGVIMRKA